MKTPFLIIWLFMASVTVWAQENHLRTQPQSQPQKGKSTPQNNSSKKDDPLANKKPTDSTQKETDPLADLIKKTQDSSIKAFVEGRIFLMDGKKAQKTDSLVFAEYIFKATQKLDNKDLARIGKILTDTGSFLKRNHALMLSVFAPSVGLELKTLQGKTEYYLLALNLALLQENKPENYKYLSQPARQFFEDLRNDTFMSLKVEAKPQKTAQEQPKSVSVPKVKVGGEMTKTPVTKKTKKQK